MAIRCICTNSLSFLLGSGKSPSWRTSRSICTLTPSSVRVVLFASVPHLVGSFGIGLFALFFAHRSHTYVAPVVNVVNHCIHQSCIQIFCLKYSLLSRNLLENYLWEFGSVELDVSAPHCLEFVLPSTQMSRAPSPSPFDASFVPFPQPLYMALHTILLLMNDKW